jgi:hypothetical protein
MTACSGTNIAELQLTKDSQTFATLHFYLVVQRDVLAGGVTSESDIYNLTEQIADIVPEVIGEDYYNKTEVDDLIAEHTFDPTNYYDKQETDQAIQDAISEVPIFDPTNYYDKSDVDTLLNGKADVSDLPDMTNYYDKSETDALLDDKADVSDLPDMSNYYNKTEVDNKITDLYQIKSVSGSIVHFTDGGDNIPVKSLVSQIVAVQSGSGTPSPSNPRVISGFDSGVITVTDNDQITNTYTFPFGQTIYGGHFDNKGNLVVTHIIKKINEISWTYRTISGVSGYVFLSNEITGIKQGQSPIMSSIYEIKVNRNFIDENYQVAISNNTTAFDIIVKDDDFTDVSGFLSSRGNETFLFELATPITLSITSQDIPTLLGENNIYSNCGDVEVEYFTEKSDGIAELIKVFM